MQFSGPENQQPGGFRGPQPMGPAMDQPAPASPPGKSGGRTKLLVGAAAGVAVVAAGAVILAPKLFGPNDPGCKAYTATALPAYNKTISDLNAQAAQATLTNDMSTAIVDLQTADAQAQSASVKSALNGLLAELNAVRTDVGKGSVPPATVSALNAAAGAADNAC
jgi:hypothetical protein